MTTCDFGGLRIAYDDSLLTPRAWTSAQSEWARDLMLTAPDGDVLELCSGAGHIGLLAVAGTERGLVCVDLNPVAALYATENARAAGVNADLRVGRAADVVHQGELFPLIIADPPWVTSGEIGQFPRDPALAIDGGDDGLAVVRECVAVIAEHLLPGGVAVLQLAPGDGQADAVAGMLAGTGLTLGERRHFPRGTLVLLTNRP